MIRQVSPESVPLSTKPHWRDVFRQAERLEAEGQIEPILLKRNGTPDLDSWAYADAQVAAAAYLEWPVILVTDKE